jgi:ankyrin repeat protein
MSKVKGKKGEVVKVLSKEEETIQKLKDDAAAYVKVDKAAYINDIKALQRFIAAGKSLDDIATEDGNPPIVSAAINNYIDACKLIVQQGKADVNRPGLGGMTALMHSVR